MAPWDLNALLLRRIESHLAGANWQRGGGKRKRPEPIKLPAVTESKPGGSAKPSGAETAQRLRNLGLVPVGDVTNPPPQPDGPEPSAKELEDIAHAYWLEQQQPDQ